MRHLGISGTSAFSVTGLGAPSELPRMNIYVESLLSNTAKPPPVRKRILRRWCNRWEQILQRYSWALSNRDKRWAAFSTLTSCRRDVGDSPPLNVTCTAHNCRPPPCGDFLHRNKRKQNFSVCLSNKSAVTISVRWNLVVTRYLEGCPRTVHLG